MRDSILTYRNAEALKLAVSSNNDFLRHRGPITCVADIPGDSSVVTSGYDGAVARYDLLTRDVRLLGYHRHLVNRISVNASGTKAATSSSDYSIILWNLETNQRERVLLGHSDDVEDFVFIDDDRGASVSRDWRCLIWDLRSGSILRVLEGHEKDALSVGYHDGKLYTSGDDMTLREWSAQNGALLKTWGPFESETDTCAISPLFRQAILGCDDGRIRAFDIESGNLLREIKAHLSGIKKVAVSPTGQILSAAYDQKILIWDPVTFEIKIQLESHPALWERSFNWSQDGTRVFGGTFDGTVLVWSAQDGRLLDEIGDQSGIKGNACFNEVAAREREIALVSDDGYVRLARLDPDRDEWLDQIELSSGRRLMNAVAFDPGSNRVVAGAHDGKIRSFRLSEGHLREEREIPLREGPINTLRIAKSGPYEGDIFAGCYSGAIVVVNPQGEIVNSFRIHDNAVKALRLHPHLPLGASCSADGILVSWNLDGDAHRRYLGPMAIIDDVDIDPLGESIASAGRDFILRVHNFQTGDLKFNVSLGRHSPKGVCFWDEDTVVVSTYWGELIQVILSEGRIHRKTLARNGISSLTRHGDFLAATSYDGGVYLVNPHDLSVARTLRAMIQRTEGSSPDEW